MGEGEKGRGGENRQALLSFAPSPTLPLTHSSSDWRPTCTPEILRRRADLLRRTRAFLDGRGLLEVETPLLSADVCVDAHLDPVTVACHGRRLFLQTSPEFAMKRLLAAGVGDCWQLCKAVRDGEAGRLHNPEFTMLEWYRVGGRYDDLIAETAGLVSELTGLPEPVRLTYREAFLRFVGLDPLACDDAALLSAAERRGFRTGDRDHALQFLASDAVEPGLAELETPVVVTNFPASQGALARLDPNDPRTARRFELYAGGLELANGYDELLDPDELRRRNDEQNRLRVAAGKPALPTGSRLLAAMEAGLPSCCGVAVGFDRLVMLATGATCLAEVVPFPFDRA